MESEADVATALPPYSRHIWFVHALALSVSGQSATIYSLAFHHIRQLLPKPHDIFDVLHFDWRSLYRLQEHCSVWHFPRPYPA